MATNLDTKVLKSSDTNMNTLAYVDPHLISCSVSSANQLRVAYRSTICSCTTYEVYYPDKPKLWVCWDNHEDRLSESRRPSHPLLTKHIHACLVPSQLSWRPAANHTIQMDLGELSSRRMLRVHHDPAIGAVRPWFEHEDVHITLTNKTWKQVISQVARYQVPGTLHESFFRLPARAHARLKYRD